MIVEVIEDRFRRGRLKVIECHARSILIVKVGEE